jgi:hypothetical protein
MDTTKMDEKKVIKRCPHESCKKRLLLTDYSCRCGIIFCSSHRAAEVHSCTFDYKTKGQHDLSNSLIKLSAKKLTAI